MEVSETGTAHVTVGGSVGCLLQSVKHWVWGTLGVLTQPLELEKLHDLFNTLTFGIYASAPKPCSCLEMGRGGHSSLTWSLLFKGRDQNLSLLPRVDHLCPRPALPHLH